MSISHHSYPQRNGEMRLTLETQEQTTTPRTQAMQVVAGTPSPFHTRGESRFQVRGVTFLHHQPPTPGGARSQGRGQTLSPIPAPSWRTWRQSILGLTPVAGEQLQGSRESGANSAPKAALHASRPPCPRRAGSSEGTRGLDLPAQQRPSSFQGCLVTLQKWVPLTYTTALRTVSAG